MTDWLHVNAPWWKSYALWLERGEVSAPYLAKAVIGDRQLIVALRPDSVRVDVIDHDWSDAYSEARGMLGK